MSDTDEAKSELYAMRDALDREYALCSVGKDSAKWELLEHIINAIDMLVAHVITLHDRQETK